VYFPPSLAIAGQEYTMMGYLDTKPGRKFYPPSQKTMGVSPWMNATVGPAVALAKVGASADSAEEMKDTTGVSLWRLHRDVIRDSGK